MAIPVEVPLQPVASHDFPDLFFLRLLSRLLTLNRRQSIEPLLFFISDALDSFAVLLLLLKVLLEIRNFYDWPISV